MKTVAIIQARFDSKRLPGKVLKRVGDKPVLSWMVQAAEAITSVDQVVVATSSQENDDPIANWCDQQGVTVFRGDKEDVLNRMLKAAHAHEADVIVRLTADCPFLDPHICDQVITLRRLKDLDYASNVHPSTWPDGMDCEVMTVACLERAAQDARLPSHREHVTPFIRANRRLFSQEVLICPIPELDRERWTLDTEADFDFLSQIADRLPEGAVNYTQVLAVAGEVERPIVQDIADDRATTKNLFPDQESPVFTDRSYEVSAELLNKAEQVIPLGTQTFSKSKLNFPPGKAPLFLTHGQGARVWDVDGNGYLDYINGLLPVVLGYCDKAVDSAIRAQLTRGISFTLATELEQQLAAKLVEIIPCAESVRFGKNGTDATSAAIRLSRAFTGRDRIAACGYHGWQDWYIGSTVRNKGIPSAVRELTHSFAYGDLGALEQTLLAHKGEFAAVIMEPATFSEPPEGYLAAVKELAHDHGALLIFDEVITGFRFSLGGAQTLFNVTPDLAAFGKSMANGMPVSAIVGRADVMHEMEEVFYSGTYGGEALSLAAALATIRKMEQENVIDHLWSYGESLRQGVTSRIEEHGLSEWLGIAGFAPWTQVLNKTPLQEDKMLVKTLFMRHMFDQGILISATHNISYAHNDASLQLTLHAYDKVLESLSGIFAKGDLRGALDCAPVQPIFQVRKAAN